MDIIQIHDIYKTFGKKDACVRALQGVSLVIGEGEMVAVMGKSGSGKSTLLNILGGMTSIESGTYLYDGKEINGKSQRELTRFRRNEVGFVVQYFALVDDLNVFHNIALPLKHQGYSRKKSAHMVREVLQMLGIEDKEKSYPDELSGGQQQRVAIARAIVKQPHLILADEPTGALDEATGEEIMKIFRELNEKGKTVVIVTHDRKVAEACDRVIYLRDGRVMGGHE